MNALLGNQKKGLMFIISAPAGAGKTTLAKALIKEFSDVIAGISYTTRLPRLGEMHGKDYFFVTEDEFQKRIFSANFLEHVQLHGIHYGTSKQWVNQRLEEGKHVLLVIDTQGAMQLKDELAAVFIFIHPPSLEVLHKRLLNRGSEEPEMIEKRMEWAKVELQAANHYDYQIVNDKLDTAYEVLRSILIAECHRS